MAPNIRPDVRRCVQLFVAAIAIFATPARGQIDMSGIWHVEIPAAIHSANWTFVQSGSVLQAEFGSVVWTGSISGSIFTLTGPPVPEFPACADTISGVVNAAGTIFTGTYFFRSFRCMEVQYPIEGRRCGNGMIDAGEQCDDDNFRDGDCCSSTCQLDPSGTDCTAANSCTTNTCDGNGTCVPGPPADGRPCDDQQFCNGSDTCQGGTCSVHSGDPCAPLGDCRACNEFTRECRTPAGFPNDCPDDGNECTDDVCDANMVCQHLPSSTTKPCTDDGNPCTFDECDGAGACSNAPKPPIYACADDGKGCTEDSCDGMGNCQHTRLPAGRRCIPNGVCGRICDGVSDDCPTTGLMPAGSRDRFCEACSVCDGQGQCIVGPITSPTCRRPISSGGSVLRVKNAPNFEGKLTWSWRRGEATELADFGFPETVDNYFLCIFEAASTAPHAVMRAGHYGDCGNPPCWQRTNKSLRFRTDFGLPFTLIRLRSGTDGQALIKIKAEENPTVPFGELTSPLATPILVQLQTDHGVCWEATFSNPSRNEGLKLNARSD